MLKNELITLIEQKRAELIKIAMINGLHSAIAIRHSEELDHLLNEYSRHFTDKLHIR
ncbi:Spo0E family sporulation regulatory protein-aspartic acid phosphatase [Cytobacillus sp. Hz8]|uniref:Spo0E family sporulation regulatory protein-aspartic acid phosphatase n=1 Tax=Cytobacillus sp. Hz8 TaxID=3347168 RepID=UPI0035DD5234